MDAQLFIAINLMAVSAVAMVFAMVNFPLKDVLWWLAANGLVLLAGAFALGWAAPRAGVIVAAVFVPLVVAPVTLGRLAQRAILGNDMRRAARYMQAAAVVHPSAGTRFSARLITAQVPDALADKVAALRHLAPTVTPAQQVLVQATIRRVAADWHGLLDDLHKRPARGDHGADIAVKPLEIRALGETERIDEMVRVYDAAKPSLNAADLADCQLFVLAFCGRLAEVQTLLAQRFKGEANDMSAYWTAIAARGAGSSDPDWRRLLGALAQSAASATTRRQAERLLATPVDERERLSGAATAIVDALANRVRLLPPPPRGGIAGGILTSPVTLVLIALILAAYTIEIYQGGAENLRILAELGAMWPPYVLVEGEWWRLVTALFLHFGPLHVGVNTFMLFLLGRDTERAFGSWRMLLIYAVGGVASSGFVLWLMANGYSRQAVLVGASGAIFALFGAIVARHVASWARTRDAQDMRAVVQLAVAVAIQTAIDLSVPQISFAAHAGGLVTGLVLGLVLAALERRVGPAD